MKNWLKAMALVGLVTGLVLGLGGSSRPQVVDLVAVPWELFPPDVTPALFGLALVTWAILTFFSASRGRVALSASMIYALALGASAIRLVGPFWFELASVTAALGVAAVWVPSAALLIAHRPEVR